MINKKIDFLVDTPSGPLKFGLINDSFGLMEGDRILDYKMTATQALYLFDFWVKNREEEILRQIIKWNRDIDTCTYNLWARKGVYIFDDPVGKFNRDPKDLEKLFQTQPELARFVAYNDFLNSTRKYSQKRIKSLVACGCASNIFGYTQPENFYHPNTDSFVINQLNPRDQEHRDLFQRFTESGSGRFYSCGPRVELPREIKDPKLTRTKLTSISEDDPDDYYLRFDLREEVGSSNLK